MSRCLSHKILVFNDHCFPRINYFKTRLMRFYPRMKNVLNFEFKSMDRGVKSMRSDDTDTKWIGDQIHKRIELGCMTTDTALLKGITEAELAIKPEYIDKATLPQSDSVFSPEFLQNNVIIIMTTVKDLAETIRLIANADWLKHAILAVFADKTETPEGYSKVLEVVKMKPEQIVIIKSLVKEASTLSVSGGNESEPMSSADFPSFMSKDLLSKQEGEPLPSPLSTAKEPPASNSLSTWRDSSESTKTPPDSRSNSPKRLPSPRHTLKPRHPSLKTKQSESSSPMSSSPSQISPSTVCSPTSSPSSSLPSSPVKTRPPSATYSASDIKRSKLDLDQREVSSFTAQKNDSVEPMDLQESEQNQPFTQKTEKLTDMTRNVKEMLPSQSTYERKQNWDMEALKIAVSLQMEVRTVSVIERIMSLLKSVRARRDTSAKVAAVTTLDKLIYEIEGLLCQSITASGIKMKEEVEKHKLSPNMTTDLLRVKGVYGCGTMYDRLNVHIEVSDTNDKEKIQEEIKKVTDIYKYKDTDYDVRVVKSRPTMYGRLVICSG